MKINEDFFDNPQEEQLIDRTSATDDDVAAASFTIFLTGEEGFKNVPRFERLLERFPEIDNIKFIVPKRLPGNDSSIRRPWGEERLGMPVSAVLNFESNFKSAQRVLNFMRAMNVLSEPIKTMTWMTDEDDNEYRFTDITKHFFKAGKDWQNLPQEILERAIESKRTSGYIIYSLFLPFKHLLKRMDAFDKADELLDITGLLDYFIVNTGSKFSDEIYHLLERPTQLENKTLNPRTRGIFPEIAICQKNAIGILYPSNFISKVKAFSTRISCRMNKYANCLVVHITNFVGIYREDDTAFVNLTRIIRFKEQNEDLENFVNEAIRLYNKNVTQKDFEQIINRIKQIIADYIS